jgi:hypothetical protein
MIGCLINVLCCANCNVQQRGRRERIEEVIAEFEKEKGGEVVRGLDFLFGGVEPSRLREKQRGRIGKEKQRGRIGKGEKKKKRIALRKKKPDWDRKPGLWPKSGLQI